MAPNEGESTSAPPDEHGGDDRRSAYYVTTPGAVGPQIGDHNVQNFLLPPTSPVRWPIRVGVIPLTAACFQQRAFMATADQIPASTGRVASGSAARVLCGLGGVGKTQVAVRYAEQQWALRTLDLLLWVTATSKDAILTGYAETACQVLGLDETAPQRAAERLLNWLAVTDKSWLIALDDLQDPGDVAGLWPPTSGSGQVVITTRRRDAALTRLGRAVVDVDVFTPEESVAYLYNALAGCSHLDEGAAGLAADLGHLPLALAQVAAYLIDRDLTCLDYRARLADRRRTLTDVLPARGELPDDHRETVAATWSLSVDLANGLAPVGLARPLLEIASLLDPNGFPIDLFTSPSVLDHISVVLGRDVETDDLRDALRCLHRLSLVNVDRAQAGRAVRVHALVQRATREALTDTALADLARKVGDALVDLWPDVESDIQLPQVLRSNVDALHSNAGPRMWAPRGHPVLFRSGQSLGESGLAAAAVTYHQNLFVVADRHLGADHQDTLAARREIARWRGEAGDPVGAAAAFPPLLADLVRVLGDDHPDTLNVRGHLGYWRRKAGDQAGAVTAYEELLADNLRLLGPDHDDTLSVRANLAHWQGEAGDPIGAATAITALLTDLVRVCGPDAISTLWNRSNLAHWQGVAGDPAGAHDSFVDLLADHLRVLGPCHPHTLRTRGHLAHWQGKAGDPAGAVSAYEALLSDYVRILGSRYPDTISTRSDLSYWQRMIEGAGSG